MTMRDRVSASGDVVGLSDEVGELTWSDINERQNRLHHSFRDLGLDVRDAVGLLGGNRREWLETLATGGTCGLVTVPINWHFSVDEIAYVLANSGAKAVVADAEYADKAAAAAEQAGVGIRISYGGPIEGFTEYDEVLAAGDPSEPTSEASGATMLYTSGTTGRPKGVRSNLQTIGGDPVEAMERLRLLLSLFQVPEGGVVLCNAPLYHGGPLVFCGVPFFLGASIVLRRKWDAEETLRLIDDHRVTTHYAVPTHFTRLLRLPEPVRSGFSGDSLRYVMHTAAPCPPAVKQQMIEWWGPVINELYGATEGGGVGTFVDSEQWLAKPGTVGRPTPVTDVLIVDDDGNRLDAGQVGQIYVKSLLGTDFEYHGDPEKTAAAHLEPGVFTHGDVGYLDDDGYLFLSDRKIDMIISGGVNIYPAEIEAVLSAHPLVADVAVFGVPDDEFGEQVKAAVELVDGADVDDAERQLRRLCRERLAGYMVPKSFDFAPLPRTPTGKLPKRVLRDAYWEGTGRSI